jgi:hypothetical protein
MLPLTNLGGAEEIRPQLREQSAMSSYEKLEHKYRLFAQLDPEHEVELDGKFINHLVAALRASSPSDRQQALDKATEAYEKALDAVLYENGGLLVRKAEHDARRVHVNQLAY